MVTERISASGSLPEQNEEFPWATILGRKYFFFPQSRGSEWMVEGID